MTDRSAEIAKQLKPCPFCGKRAMIIRTDKAPIVNAFGWNDPVYMVGCVSKNCILGMNKTKHKASLFWGCTYPETIAEKWNRRAE